MFSRILLRSRDMNQCQHAMLSTAVYCCQTKTRLAVPLCLAVPLLSVHCSSLFTAMFSRSTPRRHAHQQVIHPLERHLGNLNAVSLQKSEHYYGTYRYKSIPPLYCRARAEWPSTKTTKASEGAASHVQQLGFSIRTSEFSTI